MREVKDERNLEPEDRVMEDKTIINRLQKVIETLGWDCYDDIDVEIGGTSVSGIDVGEEYNKKCNHLLVFVSITKTPSSSSRTKVVGT